MLDIYSFDPIFDHKSKILILGTMPGPESLRQGKYYANARNQFWRILFDLFDCPFEEDYEKRTQFLLDRGIALWDVLHKCQREGALDSKIKNEEPNDLIGFLEKNPGIKHICFNGTGAQKLYKKHFRQEYEMSERFVILPSTSPTPSRRFRNYESKLEEWKNILRYID